MVMGKIFRELKQSDFRVFHNVRWDPNSHSFTRNQGTRNRGVKLKIIYSLSDILILKPETRFFSDKKTDLSRILPGHIAQLILASVILMIMTVAGIEICVDNFRTFAHPNHPKPA